MKKSLVYILVATLSLGMLFTGCGKNDGDTEKGSTESEKVDITDLYNKSSMELLNIKEYVTLGDYSSLITLKESDYVVSDEEIQEQIDYYTESAGEKVEVKDRPVEKGDIVNIDYVGKIDGVAFEGGTAKGSDLTIGSGQFIPGFEDGLIGAKIGETRDVTTKFPDEYPNNPDLEGKEAIFTVTINSIKDIKPAEFNDEFVEELTDGDYKTTAEFKEYIKKYLTIEKKVTLLETFCGKLAEKATFSDKMADLIKIEYETAVKYYESYASMYGYKLADFVKMMGYESEEAFLKIVKEDAEKYAKDQLMVYAYASEIGFTLSDETVMAQAESMVSLYGYKSVEELLSYAGAESIRAEIYQELLADKLIENLKK